MTPAAALASEIVRAYALLVGILLVGAGVLLAVLRRLSKRDVTRAWDAWRGWALMVPVVGACLFLGRAATIALVSAVAIAAFAEYARATGVARDRAITGVVVAGIAALGAVAFLRPPGSVGDLLPVAVVALVVAIPVVRDRVDGQLEPVALAVLGFLYIGWMFGHVALLANTEHAYGYLFFLLLAVELNDVAAFTVGRIAGRHKLRPTVSPGKTWEGALGGLAVSLSLPWLLRFSLPGFTATDCVLAGLAVGVGGTFGDLVVSVVKRAAGVKDMGAAIPGHGGVLDRIDSLAYAAPLFYGVVRLANGA